MTIIENYRLLNDEGKKKLLDYSKDLALLENYTKKTDSRTALSENDTK